MAHRIRTAENALATAILLTCLLLAIVSHKSSYIRFKATVSSSSRETHLSHGQLPGIITCRSDAGPGQRPSADCIFDEMRNGWVPSTCYDSELASEALRDDTKLALVGGAGHFPWFEDKNMTRPIPSGELAEYVRTEHREMAAYTWERWHMAHCLYVWRQGHRALGRISNGEEDVFVDDRVLSSGHVEHCNKVIANQDHRTNATAKVYFGTHKCVRLVHT